tara:strand:- start:152 stop:1480 length:1329 start_codon:yes stop_codon:yes gene_type:complete
MRRQRRQNTRLNLGRDPLGAGVAYSQSGFNDLGGLLSQKIQQGTAKVAAFEKQRRDDIKLEEEKAGLMVENFMANQAEGIDLTAIPDEDKGMITDFSMNQKQIYADAAQAAASMKAGSPEKLQQIAIMKQANQRLQNIEKQYNAWGGMREDYLQDFQSKNLSIANSSGNMVSAAGIFTGAQQRSFDENGNIIFTDAQGNTTRMSDIKQPFEKAWKQGDQINEAMMELYTGGEKLDDTTRPYLRNKFSRLIDNAGVEGLQSLAFDKMVGNESFFSEDEKEFIESLDTNDPEALVAAKKQFKEQLLDRMMNVADQQANNGFNKKQAANLQSQGPKNQAQNWLMSNKAFFNQYRPGNVDDVIAAGKDDKMKVAKGNPDQIASKLNEYVSSKGYGVRYNPKNQQYILLDSKAKQGYGSVRGEGQDGSLIGYGYNELNQMMQYIDQL